MLTAPGVKYEADPSLAFPLIASGCFCPFFSSPSYQLSHEKHFSTARKEFPIVSPHCAIVEHQPHLGTAEHCAVSPHLNTTSLLVCLSEQTSPTQAGWHLHRPLSWQNSSADVPCWMNFAVCCMLGKAEQLSQVSKDHKAETNSEKTLFVYCCIVFFTDE